MLIDWLRAFGLTLLVEVPIYALLLRRWCSTGRAALLGLLANTLTHPPLYFGLTHLHPGGAAWFATVLSAEAGAWLVEWSVLIFGLRRAEIRTERGDLAAVAGMANLASFGVGLLLA